MWQRTQYFSIVNPVHAAEIGMILERMSLHEDYFLYVYVPLNFSKEPSKQSLEARTAEMEQRALEAVTSMV